MVMHTVRFYQTGIWIEYQSNTDPKAGMYTSDRELSHGSLRSMEESDSKGTAARRHFTLQHQQLVTACLTRVDMSASDEDLFSVLPVHFHPI